MLLKLIQLNLQLTLQDLQQSKLQILSMEPEKLHHLRLLNLAIERIKSQPFLKPSLKKTITSIEFCISQILILGYENCGHADLSPQSFLGSLQEQLNTQKQFMEECDENWIAASMNLQNFNICHIKQQIKEKSITRGPYRSYSQELKQDIWKLNKLEGVPFSQISRIYSIPIKNIIRWCKYGFQRKMGAGRKVLDPKMQHKLNQWIHINFQKGKVLNYSILKEKALEFSEQKEFKGSKCWMKNFFGRNNILRKYEIAWTD